jgi:hypothetical protein
MLDSRHMYMAATENDDFGALLRLLSLPLRR